MNRRGFLRGLLTVGVPAVVAPAALAELLVPKRSIFLPPRGGWDLLMRARALKREMEEVVFQQMTRMRGDLVDPIYKVDPYKTPLLKYQISSFSNIPHMGRGVIYGPVQIYDSRPLWERK